MGPAGARGSYPGAEEDGGFPETKECRRSCNIAAPRFAKEARKAATDFIMSPGSFGVPDDDRKSSMGEVVAEITTGSLASASIVVVASRDVRITGRSRA
jgi:hypothetical protein